MGAVKIGEGVVEIKAVGVADVEKELVDLQQDLKNDAISFEEFSRRAEEATNRLAQLRQAQNQPVTTKAAQGVYELADAYDLVEEKFQQIIVAAPKVERAFDWTTIVSPKVRRLTEDFDFATLRMDQGLARVEKSATNAAAGVGRFQQQIMAGSYAFQDFTATSGDMGAKLNSITNNLPTLLSGLGGLGLVLANVGTVGVAVYRNWDSISGAFQNQNAIPKATGQLEGLRKSLKDAGDEMEKLAAKGYLTDDQVDKYKGLQDQEKKLKETIKAREQVDSLKAKRSEAEDMVIKAFHSALEETGPKKVLEALEKDIASSENPAVKKNFETIFNKINNGNLDAFNALIEFAKESPEKYGALAKELEKQLASVFKKGDKGGAMDEVVKKFKEDKVKEVDALNKQGRDDQAEFMEKLAKEAEDGTLAIFVDPLKDLVIKGRANGVATQKEVSHLKDQAEAEAKRLFPFLEKAFPDTFKGVVNAIVGKVREAVDKSIEQLQAAEGLSKAEAIRRLNMTRVEKDDENAQKLAGDEFAVLAGRNYSRSNRLNPTAAPLTPEMQREMGKQIQEQMKQMGVSSREQVNIGKLLNQASGNPRLSQTVDHAMDSLKGAGFDDAGAMRQLPNVIRQLQRGAGGVEQAVNRILNQQASQEAGAFNRAFAEDGRTARRKPKRPPKKPSVDPQTVKNTGNLITVAGQLGGEVAKQKQIVDAQARQIAALMRNTKSLSRTAGKRG